MYLYSYFRPTQERFEFVFCICACTCICICRPSHGGFVIKSWQQCGDSPDWRSVAHHSLRIMMMIIMNNDHDDGNAQLHRIYVTKIAQRYYSKYNSLVSSVRHTCSPNATTEELDLNLHRIVCCFRHF